MSNRYTPDAWVIVEISHNEETVRKILAGWYGGFAGSNSWQLSSGIEKTEETEHAYTFTQFSGSVYHCYKNCERLTGMTAGILKNMEDTVPIGSSVRVLKSEEYEH